MSVGRMDGGGMTYEQAVAICRDPARSVRDAKAVLRWAVSEPAPDKVWFLLLLSAFSMLGMIK